MKGYQIIVRELPDGWTWLSIKRKDKSPIHDWRELQKIKNEVCGKEREALELYPAESRLVDTSNQYHLFVMPKGKQFPFGYENRLIVKGHKGTSRQRPFKAGEEPKDAIPVEQLYRYTNLKKLKVGE